MLGPPASGKGTQAEMITAKYGIPSASPGAMFRLEKAGGTELGLAADQLTRNGNLVPDEMVCRVVEAWLKTNDGEFIFDGFPRSLGQATALAGMLDRRKTPLEVALFLDVDFETISRRVEGRVVCSQCHANLSVGLHIKNEQAACPRCGGRLVKRGDDNPETLQLRLQEYKIKTEPLIAHYREIGLLQTVDSTRSPADVFQSIAKILESR